MLFNEDADIAHFDLVNSRTYPVKFKDFLAPALFSSTFKALNLGEKIQVLSRMRGNPVHFFPETHTTVLRFFPGE